jgi:hypothetical protein
MRMTMILAAMVFLAIIAMPALAELTDYQKGVEEGLKIGFFMGNLSGAARCNVEDARSFNANVDQFNNWLAGIFDNNETVLNLYKLYPFVFNNQASPSGQFIYSEPRIGEYPAEAYYTATGTGPANSPAMGWV